MKGPITQEAKQRIDRQRQKPGCLRQWNYITEDRSGITEVRCKCCGALIKKLLPDSKGEQIERREDRVVVRERLVLTTLPNYREVEIEFDDGSKHITPCCADCANHLDEELIEAMYAADLDRWQKEAMDWDHMARRKPIKVNKGA